MTDQADRIARLEQERREDAETIVNLRRLLDEARDETTRVRVYLEHSDGLANSAFAERDEAREEVASAKQTAIREAKRTLEVARERDEALRSAEDARIEREQAKNLLALAHMDRIARERRSYGEVSELVDAMLGWVDGLPAHMWASVDCGGVVGIDELRNQLLDAARAATEPEENDRG